MVPQATSGNFGKMTIVIMWHLWPPIPSAPTCDNCNMCDLMRQLWQTVATLTTCDKSFKTQLTYAKGLYWVHYSLVIFCFNFCWELKYNLGRLLQQCGLVLSPSGSWSGGTWLNNLVHHWALLPVPWLVMLTEGIIEHWGPHVQDWDHTREFLTIELTRGLMFGCRMDG